jgi:hypothetical protein
MNEAALEQFQDPVMQAWKKEYQRAADAVREGEKLESVVLEALPLEDYKSTCLILLDNPGVDPDFLSDEMLEKELQKIRDLAKESRIQVSGKQMTAMGFKLMFNSNSRHTLTVLPFSQEGFYQSNDELNNREYFKKLEVNEDGLTWGFASAPSYFYQLLAEEMQKDISEGGCTFTVDPFATTLDPEDFESYVPTDDEVEQIVLKYKDAFLNLRRLLYR